MNFNLINERLEERYNNKLIPGYIVGVIEKGNIVYKTIKNYSENAIFRLASMTKPITGFACLMAESMGLLHIDDDISKYLPDFKNARIGKIENGVPVFDRYAKRDIKIRDILSHSSGFGFSDLTIYQCDHRKVPDTLEEACKDYASWFIEFDPGTKSAYSGTIALDIVCRIIEITSGMDYVSFLKKYVLEPLEMVDTTYELNSEQLTRLVDMYDMDEKRNMFIRNFNEPTGFEGFKVGYPSGTAGLFSTFHDYCNFATMLADGGVFKGKRIIGNDYICFYKEPLLNPDKVEGVDPVVNWGHAVYVRCGEASFQPLEVGSYGWSGAYSTHFFVAPYERRAVVMMTNLTNDGGSGSPNIAELEKAFADALKE